MNKVIFGILFIGLTFLSCKDSNQKTNSSPTLPIEQANALHNQEGVANNYVESTRKEAADLLGHRIKSSDASRANTLTQDMWHVEAVLRGSDVTFGDNLQGAWFKFKKDHTYQTGSYDKIISDGRYHFDSEKSILLILDNDVRMKPQEFNVMTNSNGVLVWVGEPTFKDNNMQLKLNRNSGFPIKKESKLVQ